jgi:hypothetical protein
MKVLLISANTEQINMPVLPLGLAYVAATIDSQGHTMKMMDLVIQYRFKIYDLPATKPSVFNDNDIWRCDSRLRKSMLSSFLAVISFNPFKNIISI